MIALSDELRPVDAIIPGRLYQGGYTAPQHLEHRPTLHVACAEESPPEQHSAERVLFLPLDDRVNIEWIRKPEWLRQVDMTAREVARVVGQDPDNSALVTCHMGLNRSGLITALSLCYLGKTPAEAIRLVRERRSKDVLCNPQFVKVVKALGKRINARS